MSFGAHVPTPEAPPAPRRIMRVDATPAPEPGFIGEGHTAVEVLRSTTLSSSDPFVLLMDDRLEISPRRVVGAAHPHAGLETVTLVLEGALHDREEGTLTEGDAVWMTAGRGIVHNEHVEVEGKARILQLWIGLPAASRFAEPRLQVLRAADQPAERRDGAFVRLYSGRSGALRASTKNHVPVTLADVSLEPGAKLELELPASHTGFFYVIAGELAAGADAHIGRAGDVAWLDGAQPAGASMLWLMAGPGGARAVLYAGEPHGERLVQRGPFVGDSEATIARFFQVYRSGDFRRVSEL